MDSQIMAIDLLVQRWHCLLKLHTKLETFHRIPVRLTAVYSEGLYP